MNFEVKAICFSTSAFEIPCSIFIIFFLVPALTDYIFQTDIN